MNLVEHADLWVDTEECAQGIVDYFTMCVNRNGYLKEHRDYVEEHVYGFGERAFHWLWKLIVDEMPTDFRFLEVGVYKGQVLSLIRLLAERTGKQADIVGVTLLSSFSGVTGKFSPFPEDNYEAHIARLHSRFAQEPPHLLVGDSTYPQTQERATDLAPFDIVYVDGCHELDYVIDDLRFYPQLLRPGGLLVVDDSACFMKQPWGYFQGIQDVSLAVRTVIELDSDFEHLLAVMHNRVWRKQ